MAKRLVTFLLLISGLCFFYSFWEPSWLSISKLDFPAPVKSPLVIVQLSDLHFHKFGRIERQTIRAINKASPDIVVVSGDTIDSDQGSTFAKQFFRELKPPLGIYAVRGNWENWSGQKSKELFNSFGVRLLINESVQVRDDVSITGYDDFYSGETIRNISSVGTPTSFCLSLFHSPQMVTSLNGQCRLALAGHTHGGQVRLPLFGAIWLPAGSGNFISGWYEMGATSMYVSRGIGTSILPVRFMSRPELVILTVRKAS